MDLPDTPRLARRATAIKESATLAIASQAKQMAATGIDVISLGTGEPDFPTPHVAKQAAIDAIAANFTHYTQSDGIPLLREAIATKFGNDNNIETTAARVIVTTGGKYALHATLLALVDNNDEVLIPAPYWTSYPELVLIAGGVPVIVPTSRVSRYKVAVEDLAAACTKRTRALIINSPSNPTGVMYSRDELESIGRWARDMGIVVISDELYERIVYDGSTHFSIGSMPELANLAVTVNGVSKAYSMTGWRIGYLTGPQEIVAAVGRIQSQATSNPCSISQMAALAALTRADDDARAMSMAFRQRRDLAVQAARDIPDVSFPIPDGAFYLLIDISNYLRHREIDDVEASRRILARHHVAVVPGTAFGAPGTIRISYACSDQEIVEGLRRVGIGLRELERLPEPEFRTDRHQPLP